MKINSKRKLKSGKGSVYGKFVEEFRDYFEGKYQFLK
jgi:hypothetical protein